MKEKMNQRVALTRRLLRESFTDILKNKSIETISVSELCKHAGINRSTFYAHYSIPSDILDEMKKDFAAELAESLRNVTNEMTPKERLIRICEYIHENRETEKTILLNSGDDEVLGAALASSFDIWGITLPFMDEKHLDADMQRLVRSFYFHGIFRVIREWIRSDMGKTPAEVGGILYEMLFG
jgi:AcrR family transcriptional regulator